MISSGFLAAAAGSEEPNLFLDLPRDLQNEILLKIPQEDYLKILEICEKYKICPETNRLWKLLWERDCGEILPNINADTLKERYILAMGVFYHARMHLLTKFIILYFIGADKLKYNIENIIIKGIGSDNIELNNFIKMKLIETLDENIFLQRVLLNVIKLNDLELIEFLLKSGIKPNNEIYMLSRNNPEIRNLWEKYLTNVELLMRFSKQGIIRKNIMGRMALQYPTSSDPFFESYLQN